MPYAIDLGLIRRFGSYEPEFVDQTLARMSAYALSKLEVDFDDVEVDPKDLLGMLLCGEPALPGIGYRYGYALEGFCRTYGESLRNYGWSGMRFGYFEVVESALAEIGVRFDPFDLTIGGVPAKMPTIEEFPNIGSLDVGEIAEHLATFEGAELDRLTDPGIRESVDQIVDWLRYCRESGSGLVCFYY